MFRADARANAERERSMRAAIASRVEGMVSMPGSTWAIIASSRSRSLRAVGRTVVVMAEALSLRLELRQRPCAEELYGLPQLLRLHAAAASCFHVEAVVD